MMLRTCLLVIGLSGLVLVPSGCSRSRALQARIVDAEGRPLAGALFYAEAYTSSGAFDFAFAKAGSMGEVPIQGTQMNIGWRAGAKLALAAFAPNRKPAVVYDSLGRVEADGITFTLDAPPERGRRWEPRVAQLSFPFESNSALAARAARPEYAELRAVFRDAYSPLASGEEAPLSREQAKIEALRRLERDPTQH